MTAPLELEEIAKIIDPTAKFSDIEGVSWSRVELQRRELAYQKANAILSRAQAKASEGRQIAQELENYERWTVLADDSRELIRRAVKYLRSPTPSVQDQARAALSPTGEK